MKKAIVLVMLMALLLPAAALAAGSVLLVELPQDAQMIENVAFDDGDFIQTYRLGSGADVQLLRYQAFDMTLGELIGSEWAGAADVREVAIEAVGAYPAQGLRFSYAAESGDALDVTLILVMTDDATLVFEAVFPAAMGAEAIDASLQAMIDSMDVLAGEAAAAGEEAEVG